MENKKKSADADLTHFEILQALMGELPCHASPSPNELAQKKDENPIAVRAKKVQVRKYLKP